MDILFPIGGLLLILLGANGLTDGAASVAKRFNIPNIVIGLTIVAFGTSAPELAVSVSSALKGSADISIGNVVGSNIFNALMIVGCTAMFAPIVVQRNTLLKEIPLSILASVVLLVCANDVLLDKAGENVLSITDGLILLCFMAIFLSYTFAIARPALTPRPTPPPPWPHLGRTAVCGRCLWHCPRIGCKRIGHRIDSGGWRNVIARTGHEHCGGIEEKPRNCHRKRGGQQPVQHLLRAGMLRFHHSAPVGRHHKPRPAGTGRLKYPVMALRHILRPAHHHPRGGGSAHGMLHRLYGMAHLCPIKTFSRDVGEGKHRRLQIIITGTHRL